MDVVTFTGTAAEPVPSNAHEYAIQEFKEYYDYSSRDRVPDQFFMVHRSTFTFAGGAKQGFSIDKDGEIALQNMTLEDALLSTVALQSRESLDRMKEWDRKEKAKEVAKASVPPSRVRLGTAKWNMENIPDWSQGKYLGTTYCGLNKVKILEDGPDKQGTVMHEMMHVVSGCKDNPEIHSLITQIAPGLVRLLQENPDLVKYLTTPSVKPAEPKKDEEKK